MGFFRIGIGRRRMSLGIGPVTFYGGGRRRRPRKKRKLTSQEKAERALVMVSLVLPPIGLIGIWQSPFSLPKKIALTVLVSIWLIVYILVLMLIITGGAS